MFYVLLLIQDQKVMRDLSCVYGENQYRHNQKLRGIKETVMTEHTQNGLKYCRDYTNVIQLKGTFSKYLLLKHHLLDAWRVS